MSNPANNRKIETITQIMAGMTTFAMVLIVNAFFTFSCNRHAAPEIVSLQDSTGEQYLIKMDTSKMFFGIQPMLRTLSKKIYLQQGADGGVWAVQGVKPGDTLVIKGNVQYTYGYFGNLTGDTLNPIVVVTDGGPARFRDGIGIESCRFMKFLSSDTVKIPFAYMINAHVGNPNQPGPAAVSIYNKSDHIEFSRFRIDSTQYGFWIKNEHFCDSSLQFWTLNYISVHDGEMHNIMQHGSYAGPTEMKNVTRPSSCNGQMIYLNPSPLGNIKFYNLKIRRMGKNGLMLCNAREGMSEIYNVDIDSCGSQMAPDQGTGIAIGGGTSIDCHNNTVKNAWLWSIAAFGGRSVTIRDNTIDRAGYDAVTGTKNTWGVDNIKSSTDPQFEGKCQIRIMRNKVTNPGDNGKNVHVYNGNYGTDNIVCTNTGESVQVDIPSTSYVTTCDAAPIPPTPTPVPPGPVNKILLLKIHVYSDKTISTSIKVNKNKSLVTNVNIYVDGSVTKDSL